MRAALLLVLASAAGSAGCGPDGRYAISWTIAGEATPDAFGCSSHGVDGIMVQALRPGSLVPADLAVFPCAPHAAERAIDSGDYVLQVSPLNARGERIVDPRTGVPIVPVEVSLTVTSNGTASVDPVTIVPNPACADGVDNDGDGLVDLADPDCDDALGESEAPPAGD